jgi:hypothetical protein
MNELDGSLQRMNFVQLVLIFSFLTSYVLALGGLLNAPARRRSALLAAAFAVAFTAFTDPWVHGALLMVFVVAGLGLFVMFTWLLARLLAPRQIAPQAQATAPLETQPASVLRVESNPPKGAAGAQALR